MNEGGWEEEDMGMMETEEIRRCVALRKQKECIHRRHALLHDATMLLSLQVLNAAHRKRQSGDFQY